MDAHAVMEAVEDLEKLVSGDGAHLRVSRLDTARGLVELELDLSVAGCADCVLPPDRLTEMVDFSLKQRGARRLPPLDRRPARGRPCLDEIRVLATFRDERLWTASAPPGGVLHQMTPEATVRASDRPITAARAAMSAFPHADCPAIVPLSTI